MTENNWQRWIDWRPMLDYLSGTISERKGTLYVCAGLRQIWDLLFHESSRKAVEVAERAADGLATDNEIGRADWAAEVPTFGYHFHSQDMEGFNKDGVLDQGVKRLLEMGVYTEADILRGGKLGDPLRVERLTNAAHIAFHTLGHISGEHVLGRHMVHHLSSQPKWPGGWLVREVFGNPFRPVTIAPEWRSEAVLGLARVAYDKRAFDRLPILADALEDAGCDRVDLLNHCRSAGPHVLGCWALDLVLGK